MFKYENFVRAQGWAAWEEWDGANRLSAEEAEEVCEACSNSGMGAAVHNIRTARSMNKAEWGVLEKVSL